MSLHIYNPNEKGRDFVVGDIHGYYDVLMDHLDDVGFDFENDRLFSCGDLVDRGPQNHKVLQMVLEPWFIPVAGNHEEMMFDGFFGSWPYRHHWHKTTGKWARKEGYKSWGLAYGKLYNLVETIKETIPTAIQINHANGKRYGIVHAAVPKMDWSAVLTDKEYSIWDRHVLYDGVPDEVKNIDYVFHGHTFIGATEPRRIANRVYLDTSVYETGALHIHEIGTEELLAENPLGLYEPNEDIV